MYEIDRTGPELIRIGTAEYYLASHMSMNHGALIQKTVSPPLPFVLSSASTDLLNRSLFELFLHLSVQPRVRRVQPRVTPDLIAAQPRAKQRFGFGR